jgi:hypothetical protein
MISELRWNDSGEHIAVYMGDQGTAEEPWPEESHEDGCPGGWYQCAWSGSVMRYRGPHKTQATDRLILDALEYLEAQESRAREHR